MGYSSPDSSVKGSGRGGGSRSLPPTVSVVDNQKSTTFLSRSSFFSPVSARSEKKADYVSSNFNNAGIGYKYAPIN